MQGNVLRAMTDTKWGKWTGFHPVVNVELKRDEKTWLEQRL